jgi:hypothetical protein
MASQVNKLSRTYAAVLDALNRYRGKGQQKVDGRGGQAVGRRGRTGEAGERTEI